MRVTKETIWQSDDGKHISKNQEDIIEYEKRKHEDVAYGKLPTIGMVEFPNTFGFWKYVDTEEKYLLWKKKMQHLFSADIYDEDISDDLYDSDDNWQPSWVIVASYDIGDDYEEYFAITKRYVAEKVLDMQKMLWNMTEAAKEKEIW